MNIRILQRIIRWAALLAMSGAASAAFAQNTACDCTQIVGTCSATFKLSNVKDDPQRLNSSADVLFTSSAPRCSKIGFYVENTPHITVLKNSNRADDRIFGTSRITEQTVSIESCKICTGDGNKAADKKPGTPLSEASQQFADALVNTNFGPESFEQIFSSASAQGTSHDSSFQNLTSTLGAMQSALQAQTANGSVPALNTPSKSVCWKLGGKNPRLMGSLCSTGWTGCERGPGPQDLIVRCS